MLERVGDCWDRGYLEGDPTATLGSSYTRIRQAVIRMGDIPIGVERL